MPDEGPPGSLIEIAKNCETVLSSTRPRAIETAAAITGGSREVPQDVLFVEAPLPPPPIPGLKLKPGSWGVVSRFMWAFGYKPEGYETNDEAWERVSVIADRLIDHAQSGNVLLCAHGYLNWMLDRHLTRKRSWQLAEREGENHYWSWRAYQAPVAQEQAVEEQAAGGVKQGSNTPLRGSGLLMLRCE